MPVTIGRVWRRCRQRARSLYTRPLSAEGTETVWQSSGCFSTTIPRLRHHIGISFATSGELRTGLSEAFMTDRQDDSYDLSWYDSLPIDNRRAIAKLQTLLENDPDPIDRHLHVHGTRGTVVQNRDAEPGALLEYDAVCVQHDSEMDRIRAELFAKFGAVPLLETYKQQCVRQQKAKDYGRAVNGGLNVDSRSTATTRTARIGLTIFANG